MKVELHVPNKAYDGYFGGVLFAKGVGVFTDAELAKSLAKQFDFEVVEVAAEPIEKVEKVVKPTPKKRTNKAKAGE